MTFRSWFARAHGDKTKSEGSQPDSGGTNLPAVVDCQHIDREYLELLRERGLSQYFRDFPQVWTGDEPPGNDPDFAVDFWRTFYSQPYDEFWQVGNDKRGPLLARMATGRTGMQPPPFFGPDIEPHQQILATLSSALQRQVVRVHGFPLQTCVRIYPTGRMNAHSRPAAGGHLVMVNLGSMQLLYSFAKINVAASSFNEEPPLIDHRQTSIALCDLFNAYTYGNLPKLARQLPPLPEPRRRIAEQSVQYAEQLLLAHEFGHLLRGHTAQASAPVTISTPVGDLSSVLARSRDQEVEADDEAIDLLEGGLIPEPNASPRVQAMAFGGVLLFFQVQQLTDRFRARAGLSPGKIETHPGLDARLDRVLTRLIDIQRSPIAFDLAAARGAWLEARMPMIRQLWEDVGAYSRGEPDVGDEPTPW